MLAASLSSTALPGSRLPQLSLLTCFSVARGGDALEPANSYNTYNDKKIKRGDAKEAGAGYNRYSANRRDEIPKRGGDAKESAEGYNSYSDKRRNQINERGDTKEAAEGYNKYSAASPTNGPPGMFSPMYVR
ncbi:hypothetical protein CJF31_00007608 [Rutstroemia sp. NJR-2017a BVV2]|nr:hypothetical protein CJF31_00007608 [Rutstroemia sp. NJR-2017a BVV2]